MTNNIIISLLKMGKMRTEKFSNCPSDTAHIWQSQDLNTGKLPPESIPLATSIFCFILYHKNMTPIIDSMQRKI